MNVAIAFWLALAVLLFWALGAYNRLVRLRGQVKGSFGPVDQRLEQVLVLLAPGLLAGEPQEPAEKAAADSDGLYAAATQLTQSLRMARKNPLDANAVAALKTAFETMHVAWQRHQADAAGHSDRDSPPTPQSDQRSWEDHTQLAREAMDTYNQAVLAYNGAIGQFPAMLLAYLFGFRAAQCL